jgi:hypothetical protein
VAYSPAVGSLFAVRYEPDEGRLYWRRGFRKRVVEVMDIRVIRYHGIAHRMAFELVDGRVVLSPVGPGLKALISELLVVNPAIEVHIGSIEWAQLEPTESKRRGLTLSFSKEASLLHRGFSIAFVLVIIVGCGIAVVGAIAPEQNVGTLRSEISRIHLPPGYGEVSASRKGTDCHESCKLEQVWAQRGSSPQTVTGTCSDVKRAMGRAFSDADPDTPFSHGEACAYFALPGGLFNGKPNVEAVVLPSETDPGRFTVELTASYS